MVDIKKIEITKVGECPATAILEVPNATTPKTLKENALKLMDKFLRENNKSINPEGGFCKGTKNGSVAYFVVPDKVSAVSDEVKATKLKELADTQAAGGTDELLTRGAAIMNGDDTDSNGSFVSRMLGWVLFGLTGLGALKLIYNKNETFRNAVDSGVDKVKNAFTSKPKKDAIEQLERLANQSSQSLTDDQAKVISDALEEGVLPKYEDLIKWAQHKNPQAQDNLTILNTLVSELRDFGATESLANALDEKMTELTSAAHVSGKAAEVVILEALQSILVKDGVTANEVDEAKLNQAIVAVKAEVKAVDHSDVVKNLEKVQKMLADPDLKDEAVEKLGKLIEAAKSNPDQAALAKKLEALKTKALNDADGAKADVATLISELKSAPAKSTAALSAEVVTGLNRAIRMLKDADLQEEGKDKLTKVISALKQAGGQEALVDQLEVIAAEADATKKVSSLESLVAAQQAAPATNTGPKPAPAVIPVFPAKDVVFDGVLNAAGVVRNYKSAYADIMQKLNQLMIENKGSNEAVYKGAEALKNQIEALEAEMQTHYTAEEIAKGTLRVDLVKILVASYAENNGVIDHIEAFTTSANDYMAKVVSGKAAKETDATAKTAREEAARKLEERRAEEARKLDVARRAGKP